MICSYCFGEVTWRGPPSKLTHTECNDCGRTNCQQVDESEEEPDDEDEPDCMFTPGHSDFEMRQVFPVPSVEAAAKRIFEVMGHDHQVEWDDCTSAQKEFYVCVAKAALGVAHG